MTLYFDENVKAMRARVVGLTQLLIVLGVSDEGRA